MASTLILSALLATGLVLNASAQTWSGAANTAWSNAGNWSGGATPGTTATVVFTGTTGLNNKNDLETFSGTINFDSAAGAFSLSAGTPGKFQNITVDDESLAKETINASITYSSNRNVTIVSGGILDFAQSISGASNITLSPSSTPTGTLQLDATNSSYTGKIQANMGTVIANGAASATGTGALGIGSGATLGGTGSINLGTTATSIANITGTLASGRTTGAASATGGLTFVNSSATTPTGALLLLSNATLAFNLGAANATNTITLTHVYAGEVAGLSGNTFSFTDLTGGTLSLGEYTLFLADNGVNPFAGLSLGTLSGFTIAGLGGDTYQLELNLVNGNYALQLDITSMAAVPEPGTWALLALGVGLVAFRRRFKSQIQAA